MKVYEPAHIRNVAFAGHGGCGKTSLCEAILYNGGVNTRIGSVDDGTSIMDFEPEEVRRKGSISTSFATVEWSRRAINILDTPGEGNFIYDSKSCLQMADSMVLVISAVDGVEVQTESLWGFAEEFSLPVVIFINKMDRERASFSRALQDIRESLGIKPVLVNFPLGGEEDFSGVVDLLKMKALNFGKDGKGTFEIADPDGDMKGEVNRLREELLDAAASTDDALIEKYLEEGDLPEELLREGLMNGIWKREVIPILCGSAPLNIGVTNLTDFIVDFCPPPLFRKEIKGFDMNGEEVTVSLSPSGEFLGFVGKTVIDQFSGKVSIFRIFSGSLSPDSTVLNTRKGKTEKTGQILKLIGKRQNVSGIGVYGDIVAVAKLKETETGDTLSSDKRQVHLPHIEYPQPMMLFSVRPKSKGDEDKVKFSLKKLLSEDPSLSIGFDEQAKEIILRGMGQIHLDMAVDKLKRKFGVEVETGLPSVPYKETIKGSIEVQGKYKKQTGGRGQYGDTWLRLEPLERGKGFEFVDKIFGGVIPKQYIPAVEKGLVGALGEGVLAGYPVTDVKVTLYDGSFHPVDSSEIAFKIAASKGFKKGFINAKPTLLEPIYSVQVVVPEEFVGDITGDLNGRRGRLQGIEAKGKFRVIKALVPLAEILTYAPQLRAMTQGKGTFTMEFSCNDEVPRHLQEKIIEEGRSRLKKEED